MLFYGIYVREVVCMATRECSCCMANVGISCYVINHMIGQIDLFSHLLYLNRLTVGKPMIDIKLNHLYLIPTNKTI